MQPALHRADLAAADGRYLLVGEAVETHQHQHLAVGPAKLRERLTERLDLDHGVLRRRDGAGLVERLLGIGLRLQPPASTKPAEAVAQDREQPRPEIGAGDELVLRLQGEHHRVLDEVVGEVGVAGEAAREHPQLRQQRRQFGPKCVHGPLPCLLDHHPLSR